MLLDNTHTLNEKNIDPKKKKKVPMPMEILALPIYKLVNLHSSRPSKLNLAFDPLDMLFIIISNNILMVLCSTFWLVITFL